MPIYVQVGKKYGGTLNALLLSSRFLLSQLTAMGGHDTTGKGADYRNTPFGNTLAAEVGTHPCLNDAQLYTGRNTQVPCHCKPGQHKGDKKC